LAQVWGGESLDKMYCIIYIYIQCGAPKIAKLVYNYNFTRVYSSYNHS
jgi:hypothetical protein